MAVYLIPGVGFVEETGTATYLLPGGGFVQGSASAAFNAAWNGSANVAAQEGARTA